MPHQQPGGLSLPLALAPQPPSRALSSSTISSLLLLHPFPMDVSFSSKSQTLIYALSLSSSHFHLPISVRREFLGCGGQLRPPGLRSRRRCRKLGFQFQSPRCLFQDSMYSDSILVVAVAFATFTALRVFYLNHTRRRREAPEGIDLIKQEAVESQFIGSESLYAEPLMKERENTVERTRENKCSEKTCISDIKDAQLFKFETNILTCEGTYKISQQPGNECLASVPAETVPAETATAKTTAAIGLSQSYMIVHEVGTIEQDYFAADLPDLLPRDREDIVAVSDMPRLIVEPTHSGSTDPISIAVTDEDYKPEHEIAEKDELLVSSCNVLPKQFVRQVSVLNEEKQPEVHSRSHFKSLSTKPPHLSIHENSRAYFRLRPALNGPDISAKGVPIACFKESSVCKQKDLVKAHDFTRDSGRYLMYQNDERNISVFPQPNRMIVKDANDPSAHLRTYNRLLKNSRLKDCVDLLESMETKGLLDMDKIYHTIFLKACKSQKAVKEAFRFTRLIKKPTLSTFNMLLSVCASSQDFEGAFRVMQLVKEAGLKPDCKLYTTLISTCAKSGKVDAMFEVFHEMVNAGVEPNVNTYGALIDGCARAGQVAKAFGAYGIMRSKKVQPDRVVFNALISACGQSGAVDRAFDVLAEMMAEPQPIEPDHVTVGALMKTCTQAGQVDRTHEVYKMLHQYNIKGTPDVYTIAVNSCSQTGDLEFACSIYDDMTKNGVLPDEMFLSTLLDVAGHAGKAEAAFEILQDARSKGIRVGNVSYSSLMGACCNAKDWQKALEVYEDIKAIKLRPTVSTLNALVTSLCDGDQLMKSVQVLDEMKEAGVCPNITTYSILIVACEKKCEGELGFKLFSQAKKDGILPNLIMCRCLTGLCLQSFQKEYSLGEPIVSFNSGKPQIDSKWASLAIMVYRETIAAGVIPTIEVFSQVLGCLQFPHDTSLRQRFVENLGVSFDASRCSNLCSFLDGFGEYDPRSFSILEEAASLGVVPRVSFKENPIIVDARKLCIHIVEVYLLTILKGLKHRLAAGAKLPNITVLLPTEKTRFESDKGEMTIKLAGRVGQTVGSLLRRLGLPYLGRESYGKIRINGLSLRRWCKPKITNSSFDEKAVELTTSPTVLARGITDQQRNIRSSNNLSLEQQGLLSHCDMKERFTVLFHAD